MLTQKESQEINLDLSSHHGPIYQLSRDESQRHPNELSNPYKTEKLMQKVNSSLRLMIILVLKLQLTDLNKPIYIDHYDT